MRICCFLHSGWKKWGCVARGSGFLNPEPCQHWSLVEVDCVCERYVYLNIICICCCRIYPQTETGKRSSDPTLTHPSPLCRRLLSGWWRGAGQCCSREEETWVRVRLGSPCSHQQIYLTAWEIQQFEEVGRGYFAAELFPSLRNLPMLTDLRRKPTQL